MNMAHRFTVTSCSPNAGSAEGEKLKKPARFVRIMEKAADLTETHVSSTKNSPECDGPYDETPIDSAQVTETINSSTALLRLEKRVELRRDLMADNESTIHSYRQTPKSPVLNVDFSMLRIHSESDHRNNLTREGTPMSTLGLAVPDFRFQRWKKRGDEAFVSVISALYAKILVIMGLAFPMSEVISIHVTSTSYLGFYIYLYLGSILYLLYVFFSLMRQKVSAAGGCTRRKRPEGTEDGYAESGFNSEGKPRPRTFSNETAPHYGSFYLRIGAVAFGVGSMIYSCLEFGQYFEVVDVNSQCHNILLAITPAARVLFTFIQMYFIFLNAKMTIRHSKAIANFGLMHMIATNLCVWLNVIIEETKHEILFDHHEDHTHVKSNITSSNDYYRSSTTTAVATSTTTAPPPIIEGSGEIFSAVADALVSALDTDAVVEENFSLNDECRRSEVLGNLVQEASPLLFPCAIEYSLISAAILYVMWKNLSLSDNGRRPSNSSTAGRRSRHHYSVDCARANKGLFSGIFVLVLTIISLIMFFALINKQGYKAVAIMEVNMARLVLYSMAFIAVLIGLYQVRELRFDTGRKLDLDDVLLIFGQIGVISYNTFTIIAAHFQIESQDTSLVLCTAIACLLQALTQTLFILDASRRNTYTSDQQRRKPGREVVTFLLVSNFAMWTVNTLEKSRADVNPVQLQFYGKWSWIIITNVSMPLAIFYRFHSTVVLCEIWKRCYKAKHEVP